MSDQDTRAIGCDPEKVDELAEDLADYFDATDDSSIDHPGRYLEAMGAGKMQAEYGTRPEDDEYVPAMDRMEV